MYLTAIFLTLGILIVAIIHLANKIRKQQNETRVLKAHLIACKRVLSWTVADIYRSRNPQMPQNDLPFLNAIQYEAAHAFHKEFLDRELDMYDRDVGRYDFSSKEIVKIETN